MEWTEALTEIINRTGHERYRALCADDHPDREAWRARMLEMATGEPAPPVDYPSRWQMARNLAGAVGRAVSAVAHGETVTVPAEVHEERLAICRGCEQFDPGPARCRICGCYTNVKLWGAQESCPLPEPKWHRWEAKSDGDDAGGVRG
jgi:Family of unknown function (DUF6171)